MNYTQNERIAQVGDNTLVVGIDIGSDKHYARAFTERGMEISRKAFVFENTESGFGLLDAWMAKLASENGKEKIMVGFEPTGHYWFPLGHHLEKRGTAFVVVAPQHVKHSKGQVWNQPERTQTAEEGVVPGGHGPGGTQR